MEAVTTRQRSRPVGPVLLALFIICLFANPLQAREVAARVQFAVGDVSATSADGSERSLKKGDRIYTGDTVKTGERGSAQLIYRDRSRMAVRVNTEFKIKEYKYDARDKKGAISVFSLLGGALRAVSGLIGSINPQRVTVETPMATIGIRGTDHEIVYITEQMNRRGKIADIGTYNKVYAGATVMKTPKGNLNLDLNQTGFVGGSSKGDALRPVKLKDLPSSIKKLIINKIPVQAKTLPQGDTRGKAASAPASGKVGGGTGASPDVAKTPNPAVGGKTLPSTVAPATRLQKSIGNLPSGGLPSKGQATTTLQQQLNSSGRTVSPSVPKTTIAPKVSIPTTVSPKVSIPTTTTPRISTPTTAAPKVSVPKAASPKVSVPKGAAPKVSVPKASSAVVPKVSVPKPASKAVPKPASSKSLPKATLPSRTLPKTIKP